MNPNQPYSAEAAAMLADMFYEIRVAVSFSNIVNRRKLTVRRLVTKGH
jgi:hypothetical protein